MLIQGYLPANFLAIRIQCFHCGAVAASPGLPDGEILPGAAIAVDATQTPMVTTAAIGPGDVLACGDAIARDYALTRPVSPPDEPLLLSRRLLEDAAAAYDRLTGGLLAEIPPPRRQPRARSKAPIRSPGRCCGCASGSIGRAGAGSIRTMMRWRRCTSWRCIT